MSAGWTLSSDPKRMAIPAFEWDPLPRAYRRQEKDSEAESKRDDHPDLHVAFPGLFSQRAYSERRAQTEDGCSQDGREAEKRGSRCPRKGDVE